MDQPCRFCLENAREAICLQCRARFDALKAENEDLKKQIDFMRTQQTHQFYEKKNAIKTKILGSMRKKK